MVTEYSSCSSCLDGSLYRDWIFKFDYDFTDGGELKDSYIWYTGPFLQARFRMGLMEMSFRTAYRSSSAILSWLKRSLLGAWWWSLYRVYGGFTKNGNIGAQQAGVFADDANEQRERNEKGGVSVHE